MTAVLLAALGVGLTIFGLLAPRVRRRQVARPPHPETIAGHPLLRLLLADLDRTGLRIPLPLFFIATIALGLGGVLVTQRLENGVLTVFTAAVLAAIPHRAARGLGALRARRLNSQVEPALIQIGKLADVRGHPYLALSDAAEVLPQPLKRELERALAEAQSGDPLPDALRRMAQRCCDNFYLHQLAELVAINIRDGASLGQNLHRLVGRLRLAEELKAEEAVELFGYRWLTSLLLAIGLAPLPWWALTGSKSLDVFAQEPLARLLLTWVVLSGVAVASLPYWLAIDEG